MCLTYLYPRILISSFPHILRFLCSCLYSCILISLCSCVLAYILAFSILISSASRALTFIPASSYAQVRVCLLVTSYPHILLSLRWCTLGACWYPHILISSGSSAGTCLGNWNQINTMGLTKKQLLWKQIMALKIF